jgi:nicotinate-nucleotide adenylyltransferase
MQCIGVLGGTFDPPHLAHLAIGAAARHALDLDRVIYVPAGDPWRKADRAVTPGPVRVRMVQAAVEHLEWAEVSTIEVDRTGPSYITETLPLLAEREADDTKWWFILGDDALEDMPHWHEPDRLLELARLALIWRPPGAPVIPEAVCARFPTIEQRLDVVPMAPLELSSSKIRTRMREGRSTEVLLPAAVRAIVDELGLYREDA